MTVSFKPDMLLPSSALQREFWEQNPQLRSCLLSVRSREIGKLDYFAYIPKSVDESKPVLVSIHGYRRRAAPHIFRFAQMAEKHGIIVFAPLFPKETHKRYQSLRANSDQLYPEDCLDNTIDDFFSRYRIGPKKLSMFGYSGGGQFAHRYLLLGKKKIEKLAMMAPGWFTLPDAELPYPYGLGWSEILGDRTADLQRLLSCPTLLFVGSRDSTRDGSLNKASRIDETQGLNRIDRAHNWVDKMQGLSSAGSPSSIEDVRLIDGGTHGFEKNVTKYKLDEILFDWFVENERDKNESS